jgi:ABC-type transport system involved in cytochrome bd biosynthesis fused ATPase/permease subunit
MFPTSGVYKIDGIPILNYHSARKVQNIISYASQRATILNTNLKKNICFGIENSLIDEDKYEKIIDISMLREFAESGMGDMQLSDAGKNISGGQMQRIGIARALYFDKEIMIFDESTSSLDMETERKIINNIKNLNDKKTIIIVSHRLENLKNCEKVYEIKNGTII